MENNKNLLFSFILISWNRRGELEYTLKFLQKFQDNSEVILVDNGSTDNTVQNISKKFPWVNIISLSKNIGIKAYNIGAEKANAKILIMLDDDSTVSDNYEEILLKRFKNDQKLGILAFKIITPSTGTIVTRALNPGPITEFWGCGFAIRKDVWNMLGGFDEDFFLYVNEHDLAIRCWDKGYMVIYEPDVEAYHRVTSMNRATGRLIELSVRNNIFLVIKNFKKVYWPYCFSVMLFTWFIRSIISNQIKYWLRGVFSAWKMKDRFLLKYKPVNKSIMKFYIQNYKLFELPWKKLIRKSKDGFSWLKPEYN